MEQDTRIGLAMGILLVGVVGALFFRNEQTEPESVPKMVDAESLDARIAERPIAPYTTPKSKIPPARPEVIAHNKGKAWQVPEFLKNDRNATAPGSSSPPPAPLRRPEPITQQPASPEHQAVAALQPTPAPDPIQTPVTKAPETEVAEYKVQDGDTLSGIAEKFLGASSRYMEIYELNKDRLRTPHDLRIGKAIRVPARVRR